jgi:hypothetical protein
VVRAEILGADTGKTVTLIRRILSAIPFEQVERPDDRLERGKRVLVQRGVPGFKMRMYRVLREGAHAVREKRDVILLVVTVLPNGHEEPKITESREPGQFGLPGWTTKLGMPGFQ